VRAASTSRVRTAKKRSLEAFLICPFLLTLLILPLAGCAGRAPVGDLAGNRPTRSVYVVSNGWHSSLVIEQADISAAVWPEQLDFADSRYLELGWGDQTAYMADRLTTRLGLRAAFASTASALQVAGFNGTVLEQFHGLEVAAVPLDPRAIDALGRFIHASYARDRDDRPVRLGPGYSNDSAFYLATGRFHVFNTCNTWVARALRSAGAPIMPALTLTATQLMQQVATFGTMLQARAL